MDTRNIARTEEVLLQTATVITAAETQIGRNVDISWCNTVTICVNYTNGDETSYDIIPKFVISGDDVPIGYWSTGAIQTFTATKFQMTTTGTYYLTLIVTGFSTIKIYGDATGGTPTGTAKVTLTLSS